MTSSGPDVVSDRVPLAAARPLVVGNLGTTARYHEARVLLEAGAAVEDLEDHHHPGDRYHSDQAAVIKETERLRLSHRDREPVIRRHRHPSKSQRVASHHRQAPPQGHRPGQRQNPMRIDCQSPNAVKVERGREVGLCIILLTSAVIVDYCNPCVVRGFCTKL